MSPEMQVLQPTPSRPVVLVVVEFGARWPMYAREYAERCDIVAIAQQRGESPQEFLRRAHRCFGGLTAQGRCVRCGIYRLSSSPIGSTRVAMAVAMLRSQAGSDDEFIVDASDEPPAQRNEIIAWVDALVAGLRGAGTTIEVRFQDAP